MGEGARRGGPPRTGQRGVHARRPRQTRGRREALRVAHREAGGGVRSRVLAIRSLRRACPRRRRQRRRRRQQKRRRFEGRVRGGDDLPAGDVLRRRRRRRRLPLEPDFGYRPVPRQPRQRDGRAATFRGDVRSRRRGPRDARGRDARGGERQPTE